VSVKGFFYYYRYIDRDISREARSSHASDLPLFLPSPNPFPSHIFDFTFLILYRLIFFSRTYFLFLSSISRSQDHTFFACYLQI
jgi:hypothetical protein